MATGTYTAWPIRGRGSLERWVGTSDAATALTTSTAVTSATDTPPPAVRRLLYVLIHYDATPTYAAGCTVTLNSEAGSAYDTILETSGANVEDYLYEPTADLFIFPGDAIDVIAKSGGGTIVSGTTIVTEKL